ncbi:glycosyltransferase [Microbulbifer sp. VAAC004]|uniref:glycosyltransferase n=1 Tax=unclassified Microbulbifer TaxID=2619833 RepID=UPI004039EB5B
MRIVQIWPELEPGDRGKAALDFIQELARQDAKPIVISAGGALVARLELHDVQHIPLPLNKKPFWAMALVRRLRSVLQNLNADVVHVHGRLTAQVVWRAWDGMDVNTRPSLVTHVDGYYSPSRRDVGLVSGPCVIASSDGIASHLKAHLGEKLVNPTHIVHWGISSREFDRSKPVSGQWHLRFLNSYPQLEGKNWWLYSGPLSEKGELKVFLHALARAVTSREDLLGLVVGASKGGDLHHIRKLEQLAQELGLEGKVLFLGERKDLRELYASSQLTFSLASPGEPSGQSAMQALAMGCSVVAYKDTCAGEVLEGCFPKGVVERGDSQALCDVGLALMEQQDKVELNGFFHEEIVKKTINIYRDLVGSSIRAEADYV